MQVTVEFHGQLSQVMGTHSIMLLTSAQTIGDVLDDLCRQQPRLIPQLARVACAVGSEIVSRGDAVQDKCTLALIPPVSGG